ncbi:PIN domain-containing protein [Chitinophaga sp. LS1]|uniref:PIN domain-containing protein n=1 Tax=Chitinophaga sp. LS1 TaxID=3051176 RepID=UPI002AAAD413|nr:PIN domain-containing protein [Chitinophaga sp. LS1]WPV65960.1 PIN domain-containing protein [Chitinophaga sp. LS1]
MNDSVFLDSNIMVYSYSNSELNKQEIARKLITDSNSFISTQVLQELCNIVTRKFKFSYKQAATAIKECCQNNNLHTNTEDTVIQACQIADRYGFSFYDSMIVSAAL